MTDRIGTPVQTSLNSNVQTLPFVNQGNTKSKGFDVELNYSFKKMFFYKLILNNKEHCKLYRKGETKP